MTFFSPFDSFHHISLLAQYAALRSNATLHNSFLLKMISCCRCDKYHCVQVLNYIVSHAFYNLFYSVIYFPFTILNTIYGLSFACLHEDK